MHGAAVGTVIAFESSVLSATFSLLVNPKFMRLAVYAMPGNSDPLAI